MYLREKTMRQEDLSIIDDALAEAQYLLSEEMQCVIDEGLYNDYQSVVDKITAAMEIVERYRG